MWVYSDYIEVKQDFVPVFSEEADRDQPQSWKSFIPHKGFYEILIGLIKALERGSRSDKLSLWMHGAYGTGKTFASFVLKHLLEDPIGGAEEYFRNTAIKPYWNRFKALRDGKDYVIIYCSSSAHITSTLKFLAEIQKAIKVKLTEKGLDAFSGDTLYDHVLDKLTNPVSAFNWNQAFENNRSDFLDFGSPPEVIEKFRTGDVNLTERLVKVIEKEGFMLADSPSATKEWLKQIIQRNNLSGIIFIWDEFTDFFRANEQVTGLQEIAQLTADTPFYLFLITHRSPEQFHRIDADTRKKIRERFHNFHFEMRTVTAYQLISHAIKVKAGCENLWEEKRDKLWYGVKTISENLIDPEEGKNDLKGLVPLHPFSAFILAKIASQFTSSQRTLFRFLKGSNEHSFVHFLQNYPRQEWHWFTADGLWDYFFVYDEGEFAESVRDVVNYYRSTIDQIQVDPDRIVFKVVMLLMALWKQMGDKRVRPDRWNILKLLWSCVDREQLNNILADLDSRSLIRAVPLGSDNVEYVIPLTLIDDTRFKEIEKSFTAAHPFESCVWHSTKTQSGEIGKTFAGGMSPSGLAANRQVSAVISTKDLKTKRERVQPQIRPYQFGTVFVVAQNEEEIPEAERLCEDLGQKTDRTAYIVIQTAFGTKRWDEWNEQMVHSIYCTEKLEGKNAQFHKKKAEDMVGEWLNQAKVGRQKIFFGSDTEEITDMVGYEGYLEYITKRIFPNGPESLSVLGTLYKSDGWGKKAAEVGLGIAQTVTAQFRNLSDLMSDFEHRDGFKKEPSNSLSLMAKESDDLFSQNGVLNLSSAWEKLLGPPYGLMPSHIGVALMAFAVKKYAYGHYWSDGTNCFPLAPDKLAQLVTDVIKQNRGCETYEIRKMSPQDEHLCRLIRDIFSLPPDQTGFPDDARKSLRDSLSKNGFPLWSLKDSLVPEFPAKDLVNKSIDRLEGFTSVSEETNSLPTLSESEDLVELLKLAESSLRLVIKMENYRNGMRNFIKREQPGLSDVSERLRISLDDLMERTKRLMNEEVWLWKPDQVASCLPDVQGELDFLEAMNQLCGISEKTLKEAIHYFQNNWLPQKTKLPLFVFAEIDQHFGLLFRELDEALSDEAPKYQSYASLIEKVRIEKPEIRAIIAQQQSRALSAWVKKNFDMEIRAEDSTTVISNIDNMCMEKSQELFKQKIHERIALLQTQKDGLQLKSLWRDLTGTESPVSWSDNKRVPISWVMQGAEFQSFFDVVNKPEARKRDDLEHAINFINNNRDQLGILNNEFATNQRFLANAAGPYKALIQKDGIDQLKKHLVTHMSCPVDEWPQRTGQLGDVVRDWVASFYQIHEYERVVDMIDKIPETRAKSLLKELAKDPLIGARLRDKSLDMEDG